VTVYGCSWNLRYRVLGVPKGDLPQMDTPLLDPPLPPEPPPGP
jgi:hypothetical protein